MAAEKTNAIVLRLVEFSETSVIVTLMTRDFGKITAMAKGARRPKSPFEAALDVLAVCRIVFLHKTSGAMSLLTEAKLERRFRSSQTNLDCLYTGYYIVELLSSLTDEGDPHPELFDIANEFIEQIDSAQFDKTNLKENLLQFELRALDLLGHKPMLTKCVGCGKEKTNLNRVSFGLNVGGIICPNCRRGQKNIVSLSSDALAILLEAVGGQIGLANENSDNWNSDIAREEATGYDQVESDQTQTSQENTTTIATKQGLGEARQLITQYITHLIGYPLKLQKFLKHL